MNRAYGSSKVQRQAINMRFRRAAPRTRKKSCSVLSDPSDGVMSRLRAYDDSDRVGQVTTFYVSPVCRTRTNASTENDRSDEVNIPV